MITSATPRAVPNLAQIRPRGFLGKWMTYSQFSNNLFIYSIFFGNSPTGQTRRRIFARRADDWNDTDSRSDLPFGGFVDSTPVTNFGLATLKKINFYNCSSLNSRIYIRRRQPVGVALRSERWWHVCQFVWMRVFFLFLVDIWLWDGCEEAGSNVNDVQRLCAFTSCLKFAIVRVNR